MISKHGVVASDKGLYSIPPKHSMDWYMPTVTPGQPPQCTASLALALELVPSSD